MKCGAYGIGRLALLASASTLAAQSPAPALDSIAKVKSTVLNVEGKIPARIQGCVTWYSPTEMGMNLQFGSQGTLIGVLPPIPYKIGQCLEVEGTLRESSYAPVVDPRVIRVLPPGAVAVPAPKPVSIATVLEGGEISNLIETSGIVHDVRWNEARRFVELLLVEGSGVLPVHIWGLDRQTLPLNLVDARVKVVGVASGTIDSGNGRPLLGIRLKTRSIADVQVRQAAPADPFLVLAHPTGSVFRFKRPEQLGHRVKFLGVVTAFQPGRQVIFNHAGTSLVAGIGAGEPLVPGDLVEIAGFPLADRIIPTLEFAVYRKAGVGPAPEPLNLPVDADEEPTTYTGRLVTAEVSYLESYKHVGQRILRVRFGDKPLLVQLPESETLDLEPGSGLRVTGVYWVDRGTSRAAIQQPSILARSAADIVVVKGPPLFSEQHLWWMAVAISILGVAVGAWVFFLRRRVHQQTKQIRARLESEASLEARYRDLFDNANDAIYTHNYSGQFTSWNRAAERILGYSRAEILGCHVSTVLSPDQFEFANELLAMVSSGGQLPDVYQIVVVAKDGRQVHLEAAPRRIDTPEGPQIECIARDISRRMEHARELEEAKERAESATRAKTGFLANMSHELRTPVNGILGMNQLLRESPLNPEQREWCDAIDHSGTLLVAIMNDILDVTKIESGRMLIDRHPLDLHDVLTQAHKLLLPKASAQSLALVLNYAESAPRRFFGDALRIRQIVLNFLSNAIKFTPAGRICLDTRFLPSSGNSVTVRISVTDTGIGIPAAAKERLFQKFVQADSSTTRQYGGTGLGLSISRDLAHLMGGSVGCESTPGEGSTFWLEMPLELDSNPAPIPTKTPVARRAPASPPGRGKLLIVDDNRINQKLMLRLLESRNFNVVIAENGEEAIARCREEHFEAILMDCQMPVLDGYQATAAIRALEGGTRHTPIIALTANAMSGDREQCIAAGMDDYLSKPVHREELDAALGRWLELTPSS